MALRRQGRLSRLRTSETAKGRSRTMTVTLFPCMLVRNHHNIRSLQHCCPDSLTSTQIFHGQPAQLGRSASRFRCSNPGTGTRRRKLPA